MKIEALIAAAFPLAPAIFFRPKALAAAEAKPNIRLRYTQKHGWADLRAQGIELPGREGEAHAWHFNPPIHTP